MVFNPRKRSWMCAAIFLCATAMATVAHAAPVGFNNLRFDNPVGFGFGTVTVISNAFITGPNGTYTLNAELCQTGSCQGDFPSETSQLRLTNLSLTCSSSSFCDPVDISFEAAGFSEGQFADLSLSLDGGSFSGPGGFSGTAVICVASGSNLCSQNLSGLLAASFGFGTNLSGSLHIPFAEAGEFTVFGDFHLNGLANGTTVFLGNSFEITDITDTGAAAPEPSAMFLLPAGLAAIFLFRRRLAAR